jgi:AAA15 family ATPase/GTPase
MITKINAKNFKGLEFNQEIGPKTLIIGPNGAGKSARVQALELSVNGAIPGTDKTNPAIHAAFATDPKLFIGFEIGKASFTRRFSADDDGRVRQDVLVDRKKANKSEFEKRMAELGNPKVFDLGVFLEMSDQKKIDYIFNLYPPAGDVADLENKIETTREKLNKKTSGLRETEKYIQQANTMRSSLQLPTGTLAEMSAEIRKLEKELQDAQEALKKEEIEQAQKEAQEKFAHAAALPPNPPQPPAGSHAASETAGISPAPQPAGPAVSLSQNCIIPRRSDSAAESILAIMEAIKSVGCPVCANGAAMMVAKRELRKYEM